MSDYYPQPFRVNPEGTEHGFHSRYMPLVVSPPDINHSIKPALSKLVVVVGDIGGKIGRGTVAAHDDIVFVLTQGGRDKPGSPFLFSDIAPLLKD